MYMYDKFNTQSTEVLAAWWGEYIKLLIRWQYVYVYANEIVKRIDTIRYILKERGMYTCKR